MYSKFVVQFIVSDKKAACSAISGYVKARRRGTVTDCNIECCTGGNCNDGGNVTKNFSYFFFCQMSVMSAYPFVIFVFFLN